MSCIFLLFLVLLQIFIVNGQYYSQSPCPEIFEFKSDGRGSYGALRLQPIGSVSTVIVKVNFTVATRLPTTYVGNIELLGSELSSLQNFNRGVPINYRINFPVSSPLPRVTGITANNNLICYGPGDSPGPGQYVTTISLQHTLFQRNGINGAGGGFDPQTSIYVNNIGPQFIEKPSPPIQQGYDIIYNIPNTNPDRDYQPPKRKPDKFNRNPPKPPPRPVYQPPEEEPFEATQYLRPEDNPDYEVTTTRRTTKRPRTTTTEAPTTPRRQLVSVSDNVECGISSDSIPLIYQGSSYQRGEWPWLVAIYKRRTNSLSYICSGTLVSNMHVITAAHCMHGKTTITSKKDIVVKVGVYNLDDWDDDDITVTRKLSFATIHESYNATNLANDILVMTLEREVKFNSNIKPACLWSGNTDLNRIVGTTGVVTGWGATESGPGGGGEPRMVRMPVVSTKECRSSKLEFHKLTSHNTLCAGDRTGAGPCLGDSGGGLYIKDNGRWKLRGVVSLSLISQNGDQTCNLDEYVVFTDAAQYLKWIKDAMSKKSSDK